MAGTAGPCFNPLPREGCGRSTLDDGPAGTLSERPDPDGAFALDQAFRRESEALEEYKRVLTIFSELILHGTVPDEDP